MVGAVQNSSCGFRNHVPVVHLQLHQRCEQINSYQLVQWLAWQKRPVGEALAARS